MPLSWLILRGKWSKRILLTLCDAGGELSPRLLKIRCGVSTKTKTKNYGDVVTRLFFARHIFYELSTDTWHLNEDTARLVKEAVCHQHTL